ncbi:rod shape-determining protein MreC [Nonlabens tegetincola]|uniref:rod shape-determining protein MreC n=1 Tax=Nonlabens tegetincola TaxID=323273 RepID=UPI000CF4942B|nr:rod shape-determining protein MreC [Nonlabens tegetincola]PQJ20484.1 rod shape-determining protein MreC [Nonlabens tegetincola]
MQQIINFLIKYRNLLLFLFLLVISISLTVQSHDYTRYQFIHSSGNFTGGALSSKQSVADYFNLKQVNQELANENAKLRMLLDGLKADTLRIDTTTVIAQSTYKVIPAKVIKNSFLKKDNYLTLDIGEKNGIEPDMGVITDKGIIGIIDRSNSNYSRVISVLSSDLSINAQIKGSNVIGSLKWDGQDPYYLSLEDVPRLAQVKKGDTIITGKQSTLFPPNIEIGTITKAELIDNGAKYKIDVQLFNDLTDLGYVYVVKNKILPQLKEIDTLGLND